MQGDRPETRVIMHIHLFTQIRNYFVVGGQSSLGIASAAGMGKTLVEWIVEGEPPCDLWPFDVARFDAHYCNKAFLNERTVESLGRHYAMPWPKLEMETSRGVKQSPFHSRLESARASWGAVMGWERPSWFARENGKRYMCCSVIEVVPYHTHSHTHTHTHTTTESRVNENTFGKPNWFDRTCEEHLACREAVAMFDLTSFSKFEIEVTGTKLSSRSSQ